MAESSATVVIPGNSMPWKCTVNGVTYTYAAGTEVKESSLPAGVLAEIKAYWAAQKAEETGGGTGGGSSGGVATAIWRKNTDAEGQSAEGGVAVRSSNPTYTQIPFTCDNMTYAQALAVLQSGDPLAVMLATGGGWATAVAVVITDGYICPGFFMGDGGSGVSLLYWNADGIFKKSS